MPSTVMTDNMMRHTVLHSKKQMLNFNALWCTPESLCINWIQDFIRIPYHSNYSISHSQISCWSAPNFDEPLPEYLDLNPQFTYVKKGCSHSIVWNLHQSSPVVMLSVHVIGLCANLLASWPKTVSLLLTCLGQSLIALIAVLNIRFM